MDLPGIYTAEYTALKQEQTYRIVLRETIFYTSILFDAAVVTAQFTKVGAGLSIFYVIPFGALLMAVLYSFNDSKASEIRDYIKEILRERLKESLNPAPASDKASTIFGWEDYHRRWRFSRVVDKILRLVILLGTFSGVPIYALFVLWSGPDSVLWWSGCVAAILSTYLVFATLEF